MKKHLLPVLICFVITTSLCHAQTSASLAKTNMGWTITHPFEHHVFIENKGQFTEEEKEYINQPILYYNQLGKIQMYFSASSITFRYDSIAETKDDDTANQNESKDPDQEKNLKDVPQFLTMTWQNASPNATVEVQEPESDYFTYSNPAYKSSHGGIVAHAWKKLVYHNLYKGIDVEFYYPDKGGIEYNIIVHPGANLSELKMAYSGNVKITLKGNDAAIFSPGINLTDHAPTAKDGNGNPVATSFSVNNNSISFKTGSYDKTQTLIIDPWLTNPNFFVYNVAYDINYDNQGNVYIGGGLPPYELQQYDSSGTLVWSYSLVSIYQGSMAYWGDFTTDIRSGTSYVVRGLGGIVSYENVVKINNTGIPIAVDSDARGDYTELWRVAFDYTNNQLVCGGGLYYPVVLMDTNLTSITRLAMMDSAPPFVEAHDMFLLALDNQGSAYMATDKSSFAIDSNLADNWLYKMSLPTLTPVIYRTRDHFHFVELISLFYYPAQPNGSFGYANGFNGMAANKNMVMAYDGATLKKYRASTGILTDSVKVTGTSFQWGGLDLDCEGNVYAGNKNRINVYDSSLNFLNAITLDNNANVNVYALKVGNGKIYACGFGFVQAVNIAVNPYPNIAVTPNPASYCTGGSIAITASGGATYTWLPATGLSATTGAAVTANPTVTTTYTVSGINANGCVGTTTVVVTVGSNLTISAATPKPICGGDSATLTVNGGTSYTWSPLLGLSATTGATVTANPATTTTYTINGSNGSGCTGTTTVSVTVNPAPTVSVNTPPAICSGDTATLTASGGITYTWAPAIGLNVTTGSSVIANPGVTTTYTVTGTNPLGCSGSKADVVTITPSPAVSINPQNPLFCSGQGVSLTASGGKNYTWRPAAGLSATTGSNVVANPSVTTTYSVTETDSLGCPGTAEDVVTIKPSPVAKFTFTYNGNQVIFNSAGSSSDVTTYSWNFGDNTTSTLANPTHTFSAPDTFNVCLTVYNGSDCSYTLCQDINLFTSISNVSAQTAIQLYPNPANNSLNLYIGGIEGNYQLKIYNVLGQQVAGMDELTLHGNETIPLSLDNFPEGTYELILSNENQYYSKRFVHLR